MSGKIDNKIIKRLQDISGKENIYQDEMVLEAYSRDETPGLKGNAEAVVKVKEKKEIFEVLKLSNSEKIPVTPRGGGTGLSGGAVPVRGGIVLSLERMNRILDIDKAFGISKVEPGVINGVLQREAETCGLFYPVNPASQDSCTIGGNVAEASGGANAVRYGTTRNYVLGLEAVLPQCQIIKAGGSIFKNATDYDMVSLMLGSEGTLGIISEVILKLIPKPKYQAFLIAPFRKTEKIFKTVERLWEMRFNMTMVELMDKLTAGILEKFLNKKIEFSDCEAQLVIRLDENKKEDIVDLYEKVGKTCLEQGAVEVLIADTALNFRKVWEIRQNIHEALVHYGLLADEDVVVPLRNVENLMLNIKEISCKYKTEIAFFGHLGDGNIHVNFLKKGVKKSEVEIPDALLRELFEITSKLDGKVSGEHGIGVIKKPYLSLTADPGYLELRKKIKDIFDPNNIMNPGKIL